VILVGESKKCSVLEIANVVVSLLHLTLRE
jgi:hypothetical protein